MMIVTHRQTMYTLCDTAVEHAHLSPKTLHSSRVNNLRAVVRCGNNVQVERPVFHDSEEGANEVLQLIIHHELIRLSRRPCIGTVQDLD